MEILIGMDEAGYGPNFGPLVVAATAWHVDDAGTAAPRSHAGDPTFQSDGRAPATARGHAPSALLEPRADCRQPTAAPDLYRLLRGIVAKSPSERRIAIADSKALYNPAAGLRQLERGIHAVLGTMGESATCWHTLLDCCRADPDGHHARVCWPDGYTCRLPLAAAPDELARLVVRFTRACNTNGVRPLVLRARLVFPHEFNELVAHYGSKGAALSHVTVGLLRETIEAARAIMQTIDAPCSLLPAPCSSPIHAVCDKHGGRNYYTALLQHHFTEHWVEPVFESRAESRYEWGPAESRVRVAFRTNGERFLPTALASMAAKYLRELSMRAFNEFWARHVPDLRPTAGYPTDSHRFRKAIAPTQRKLGIDDHLLWRTR